MSVYSSICGIRNMWILEDVFAVQVLAMVKSDSQTFILSDMETCPKIAKFCLLSLWIIYMIENSIICFCNIGVDDAYNCWSVFTTYKDPSILTSSELKNIILYI